MSDNTFATGHCLCEKVSYTITSEPVRMGQCHCDDCQRTTGTGHASNAFFNRDDVTITGETNSYASTSDSGAVLTRHFCPNCGSFLFGTSDVNSKMIGIAIGCLDDSAWFKPAYIVYNKRKPVWDIMDETIPTFEEMPPPPPTK